MQQHAIACREDTHTSDSAMYVSMPSAHIHALEIDKVGLPVDNLRRCFRTCI